MGTCFAIFWKKFREWSQKTNNRGSKKTGVKTLLIDGKKELLTGPFARQMPEGLL